MVGKGRSLEGPIPPPQPRVDDLSPKGREGLASLPASDVWGVFDCVSCMLCNGCQPARRVIGKIVQSYIARENEVSQVRP